MHQRKESSPYEKGTYRYLIVEFFAYPVIVQYFFGYLLFLKKNPSGTLSECHFKQFGSKSTLLTSAAVLIDALRVNSLPVSVVCR